MVRSSLLAFLLAASIAWPQAPADDKPATVEGTVTNALTGEPLLRAHVSLRGMAGGTRRNFGALTNAEGKFTISAPAGSYAATAERVGFSPTSDRQGRMGVQIAVGAGDKKDDLKIRLNPNGAISGRVTDTDGEPMEGVMVSAEGSRARGMNTSATTDEKGQFRISGLTAGKYRVRAHPANPSVPAEIRSDGSVESHYAQTYYPNVLNAKGATRVNLAAGAEVGGIGIQLVRTPIVRVSGTVTGAPAGERVMIEAATGRGPFQMGSMREDGTFQLWRLDPGKYLISASANTNGQNFRSAPVEVEVAASNIDHVELRIFPPADIAGQVEFEDEQAKQGPQPPPSAQQAAQQTTPPKPPPLTVVLRETNGRSGASAPVGADGSFKLEGMSPGRYRASLTWGNVYVRSMRLGQVDIDGNMLDLSGGSYGATLRVLVSSATGEISGVVSDGKGPAAQIPVGAVPADAGFAVFPAMTTTGDDGSFRLTGLAPGKYRLLASEDNLWARAQDDETEGAEVIEINRGDKVTRDLKLAPME